MIAIEYARDAERDGVEESASSTVKFAVPELVGVPEIIPELALSERPSGKEPLTIDQLYGVVPPVALRDN